jgi:hypothetical protein
MGKESSPISYQEEVKFEKGSNAVVMVATTTQKEAFLSPEQALKKIHARARKEMHKTYTLLTLGLIGLFGGLGVIINGAHDRNDLEVTGGFLAQVGSLYALFSARESGEKNWQLRKQEYKIESIINSNK